MRCCAPVPEDGHAVAIVRPWHGVASPPPPLAVPKAPRQPLVPFSWPTDIIPRRRKPPVQKTAQFFHLSQRNRASTAQSQGHFFSYFSTPDHRILCFDQLIFNRACLWARLYCQRMSFSSRSVVCNNFHLISLTLFDSAPPIPI